MECGPLRHSPAGYAAFGRRAWLLEEHDARLPSGQWAARTQEIEEDENRI